MTKYFPRGPLTQSSCCLLIYSITVFPCPSVFLLILLFLLYFHTMTYLILSLPSLPVKTPISASHVHQLLTLRLTFPPSLPSITLFPINPSLSSVILMRFFCLFFQLSLWLRPPLRTPAPTPYHHHRRLLLRSDPPPRTCVVRSDYRPLHCPRQVGLRH